jgi:hedgehog interacting protein
VPFCLFSEAHVHVCDFHREKAWNEWVSKTTNEVSENRAEVLQYLRNIAKSANQRELQHNITVLKKSQPWKESVPLQKYFTEFWGLHLQVLLLAYLHEDEIRC